MNRVVWSIRICWEEVTWNEHNERLVATRFCLLMDATENKGWSTVLYVSPSGVLCTKDATSVGTGRGASSPPVP